MFVAAALLLWPHKRKVLRSYRGCPQGFGSMRLYSKSAELFGVARWARMSRRHGFARTGCDARMPMTVRPLALCSAIMHLMHVGFFLNNNEGITRAFQKPINQNCSLHLALPNIGRTPWGNTCTMGHSDVPQNTLIQTELLKPPSVQNSDLPHPLLHNVRASWVLAAPVPIRDIKCFRTVFLPLPHYHQAILTRPFGRRPGEKAASFRLCSAQRAAAT